MHRNVFSFLGLAFLLSLVLVSCNTPTPDPTQPASLPDTPTTVHPTETAVIPTDVPTATPVPAPERAKYTINATLDYVNKTVSVDQAILYPNHSGETLTDLVLAVEPDMWPGSFNLTALNVDESPITDYNLNGQKPPKFGRQKICLPIPCHRLHCSSQSAFGISGNTG